MGLSFRLCPAAAQTGNEAAQRCPLSILKLDGKVARALARRMASAMSRQLTLWGQVAP